MEDEQIIKLFFDRSEDALTALNDKYGSMCLHIANNILSDVRDAEECVNDTCLAVWNAIPPEKPDCLQAYTCRIARNLALKRSGYENALKRRANHGVCLNELSDAISDNNEIESRFDAEQLREMINTFLSGLKKPDRVLFIRRYWYSDSYEQLSRLSGMREGAIRTKLSRIRKKLKEYLEKRGVSA